MFRDRWVLAWRYEHRRRRRDLLHVFSFDSGCWPFPKDSGHLGRRPSLNPAWSISPGSIFLEDSDSVSTTFFCCSCMDYSFCLLFAFVSMCRSRQAHFFLRVFFLRYMCVHIRNTMTHSNKRNTNQPADWKMLTKKNPTRGTDTFSVVARSFCPALWHSFVIPVTTPCSVGAHKEGTHVTHAKGRDLKPSSQLTQASTSVHVPCDSSKVACMMFFLENHGTSSFQRLLTLLL